MCQVCNPRSMWHPSALLGLVAILGYVGFILLVTHGAGVW